MNSTAEGLDYCARCGGLPRFRYIYDEAWWVECDDCGHTCGFQEARHIAGELWNIEQREQKDKKEQNNDSETNN